MAPSEVLLLVERGSAVNAKMLIVLLLSGFIASGVLSARATLVGPTELTAPIMQWSSEAQQIADAQTAPG